MFINELGEKDNMRTAEKRNQQLLKLLEDMIIALVIMAVISTLVITVAHLFIFLIIDYIDKTKIPLLAKDIENFIYVALLYGLLVLKKLEGR